jgi:hypothetical protein
MLGKMDDRQDVQKVEVNSEEQIYFVMSLARMASLEHSGVKDEKRDPSAGGRAGSMESKMRWTAVSGSANRPPPVKPR